jgi:ABC-type sugar transport system ATPase subunit
MVVEEIMLRMDNINKYFPGVQALRNVNFELRRGEVHALLGENGAGKSTLIKIVAGIHKVDSGEIFINGEKAEIHCVEDSERLGISVIFQELALAENMTVAENIFMGREPLTRILKLVNYKKMREDALKVLDRIGIGINPNAKVSSLGIAQKQVVEIAKALSIKAQIIVMDEPTASLSKNEVDKLFQAIENLKKQKVSILYISHRIEEIFKIADRVSILRDGSYIGTKDIKATAKDELIKLMIGRELIDFYKGEHLFTEEVVLEVCNISNLPKIKNISLKVRKGEIVGISGLVGAGRTEMARMLFGIDPISSGKIILDGKEVIFKSPRSAIRSGITLVPESRKDQGLILTQAVGFNITLCVLEKFMSLFRVRKKVERSIENEYIKKLSIKMSSRFQNVLNLSGGNQQKVVLGKWLAVNPKVLILDEPTRGVDVGAKAEIYKTMNDLAKQGVGIIMISSELPEIINMSDRVYVMKNGEIKGCLNREDLDQEKIMRIAAGVNKK